ncbi:MAG: hypothetical protein HS132_02435 [Planctomycetia bacterium]|nr:hypothetical protein [Planctomycetia bacterium]
MPVPAFSKGRQNLQIERAITIESRIKNGMIMIAGNILSSNGASHRPARKPRMTGKRRHDLDNRFYYFQGIMKKLGCVERGKDANRYSDDQCVYRTP